MSMGRYLCQLCYSIVQYGERHPCFFYKDDDEVYTVPPPNEYDEMDRRGEKSMETNNGNLYENNGRACSSAVRNDSEGPNLANSLLNVNYGRMSLMPLFRRKRGRSTPLPSEFVRGKRNRYSDSKPASNHTKVGEKVRNVAKKSENAREMRVAPADVLPMGGPSNAESSTSSAASAIDAAAASVAGPSGTRGQTHETGKEKTFECDVCGKVLARKDNFDRHYRGHTGEKPFPCPKCDKQFTRKCNLKAHLRTHTGELPFPCDVCGKRFSQKGNLTSHLRTHTGETPYRCEFCGREFAQLSNLKTHEKTKHGKK